MEDSSQENPILRFGPKEKGQLLYFFGARHTNDADDVQFEVMRETWEEFRNTSNGTIIMLIEAKVRDISIVFRDAIRIHGEVGAALWLARDAGARVLCPEPDDFQQRMELCRIFDARMVAYALIAQNLSAWFRHSNTNSFEAALQRTLKREAGFDVIYGFIPDAVWFREQHRKLFSDQPFEDKTFLDSIADPRKNDTDVNKIVAARTNVRNASLYQHIEEQWAAGNSVFIVYGKGHLTALSNKLNSLTDLVV